MYCHACITSISDCSLDPSLKIKSLKNKKIWMQMLCTLYELQGQFAKSVSQLSFYLPHSALPIGLDEGCFYGSWVMGVFPVSFQLLYIKHCQLSSPVYNRPCLLRRVSAIVHHHTPKMTSKSVIFSTPKCGLIVHNWYKMHTY